MAHARVPCLAVEADAARLQRLPRLLYVGDAKSDAPGGLVRLELTLPGRGIDEVEADVLAQLELREALRPDLFQAERVAVELRRPFHVLNRYRHEVGPLDDQPTEPSICSW